MRGLAGAQAIDYAGALKARAAEMTTSDSKAERSTPVRGQAVCASPTGRPAPALLTQHWASRVQSGSRESAPVTVRERQHRCGQSIRGALNDRLPELRRAHITTAKPGSGCQLTRDGKKLLRALALLNAWSERPARPTARSGGG
jgi:hypothetical protein